MSLSLIKSEILQDSIDLEGIEALLTYLSLGFSFNSSFPVIKRQPRTSIPKTEADAVKLHFSRIIRGKQKSYLRARIPLILIGLIGFGLERARGESLETRVQNFKALWTQFDESSLDGSQLRLLQDIAAQGLKRRYYTSKLNPTLDSVSSFFAGVTPNSYSNAVEEFIGLTRAMEIPEAPPSPTEPPAEPPKAVLTPVEDAPPRPRVLNERTEPTLTVVPSPTPEIELVEPLDDTKTKSTNEEDKDSAMSNTLKFTLMGGAAALLFGYFIYRKRD